MPVTFSIPCIGWYYLHIHVPLQHKQHVPTQFFNHLTDGRCIAGIHILLFKPIFKLYSVPLVGTVRNMFDNYLFILFSEIPHLSPLAYELLINPLAILFRKFINVPSVLRKIFISTYAFTSVHTMEKGENQMGHQVFSPYSLQTNLVFTTTIMPQVIVIPPPSYQYKFYEVWKMIVAWNGHM